MAANTLPVIFNVLSIISEWYRIKRGINEWCRIARVGALEFHQPTNVIRGNSSVLFAYLFLLLFGQIDNIYKVEQDSLYF